jgi:type II secretory ATPase GspE/PulE/Tfp pilus assembly ATPase PilB-like protein
MGDELIQGLALASSQFLLRTFHFSPFTFHLGVATVFPRGPGLYLNLFSLLAVLLVYFGWIRLCVWVDRDARQLKLNRQGWNLLVFLSGVCGLGLFWLVPWFPIAFTLLLAVIGVPLACYIVKRNAEVPELERVCTERHLRELLNQHVKTNLPLPEPVPDRELALLPKAGEEVKKDDPPRVKEARAMPGFEAAMQLLCAALDRQTNWVEIEPAREWTRIRFRIDGVPQVHDQVARFQGEQHLPVLKRLADLPLDEHRKPQAGSFEVEIDGRRLAVQVRSSGTIVGERLRVRLREQARPVQTLDDLDLREQLGRVLRHHQGIFVVCGVADSGRTTAGYACVLELERQQQQVVSLEAEIEQRLPQVEQLPLDAANREPTLAGLQRLFQRSPAGPVFVDCPLDTESVEFIYERATEQFILLVMEAEDAVAAMGRLSDLGLSPTRLAKKLMGVLSVRLVRKLCTDCKVRYKPSADVLRKVNLPVDRIEHFARPPEGDELLRNDAGEVLPCLTCQGLGYRGRQAVSEVLVMNERIRELLRDGAPLTAIRQEAVRAGLTPQGERAMELVIAETTSVSEMIGLLRTEVEEMPLAVPEDTEGQLAQPA